MTLLSICGIAPRIRLRTGFAFIIFLCFTALSGLAAETMSASHAVPVASPQPPTAPGVYWASRTLVTREYGVPFTEIFLYLPGTGQGPVRIGEVAGGLSFEDPGDRPSGTLMSCASWWAGEGDRFYVVPKGRVLSVLHRSVGEGPDSSLEEVARVSLAGPAQIRVLSPVTLNFPATPRTLFLSKPAMNGDDVDYLQFLLKISHYDEIGQIDGWFGQNTRNAVLRFQKDHGLAVDGAAGPQTWATLSALLDDSVSTLTN